MDKLERMQLANEYSEMVHERRRVRKNRMLEKLTLITVLFGVVGISAMVVYAEIILK